MDEQEYEDKNQTVFKDDNSGGGGKSSTGLDENIASLLCYLVGFISGIIFLIIEKDSKTVKFHAIQSISVFVVLFVGSLILGIIPLIGWILSLFLAPVGFILWIFLMYKAYQGGIYKLPVIGDFVENQIK